MYHFIKKQITIIFLLCLLNYHESFIAQNKINVLISNKINLLDNPDMSELVDIYKYYYENYENKVLIKKVWNKNEVIEYGEAFDLGSNVFQGISAPDFILYFDFYFLEIIKLKERQYSAKVLIQSKNGLEDGSSVWCIQKISFINENNKWYLQNNIINETFNWKKKRVGNLIYKYPVDYKFDKNKAIQAKRFIKNLGNLLQIKENDKIYEYTIANSVEQLGLLQNFSYYFVGITTGVTLKNKYIMTTISEYHAHELVHLILLKNDLRNFIIEEGAAEYFGTKTQNIKKYQENQKQLINYIKQNKLSPSSFLSNNPPNIKIEFNYKYALGSLLFEYILSKGGNKELISILASDTSNIGNLNKVLSFILNMKENDVFNSFDDFVLSK